MAPFIARPSWWSGGGNAPPPAASGKTREVGKLNGGWPLMAVIAFTTQNCNGLAVAAQAALNTLTEDGSYAGILDRWGLTSEATQKSELNPAGISLRATCPWCAVEKRRR